MQALPAAHYRICLSFTQDSRALLAHDDTSSSIGGKKIIMLLPFSRARKLDVGT